MKKLLLSLFLSLLISLPVFSFNRWFELFEKKYIDMTSLNLNYNNNTIKFWTKNLNKNPQNTIPNIEGKKVQYWYSMAYWNIDCKNKMERIEALAIYDLKERLINSDYNIPEWQPIIPDSYAEGYFRMFCLIPFEENPLLKN